MKKLFLAVIAISFASLTCGQTVKFVSDSVFRATVDTIRAPKNVKTVAPNVENGFRGLHVTAGATYAIGRDVDKAFNGTVSLGYQVGRNGGFEFGAQAEGGTRFAVEGYGKVNLGRYSAESYLIPALKIAIGACEQDMWAGASTDPEKPQGVKLALACPRMAACASAEFDLKWKPTRREPRFYLEAFGGYRHTPKWGTEMKTGSIASDGSRVYEIESPMKRSYGYFFVGIRLGFAAYRTK